ncbi:hypothetical protein [Streptomyces globosus]|uniref:hypothetical protein n=1 Tax=Streptomyces globosus TaxID=68209 RepID=UPI0031D7F76E
MTDTMDWRTHWELYEDDSTERGVVQDVCSGIRLISENGAGEPLETIALSVAGAEAAEALTEALEHEWALYTPGEVAAVASAVFSQLEGVLANLHALKTTLGRMEARQETAFTGTACDRLEDAAAAVDFARGFAPGVLNALQDLPQLIELPADAHELLAAVADLLGPDAELHTSHDPGAYCEDDSGFGCGCHILIKHAGEVWSLSRGDSVWSMTRESEGKPQPDGSTRFSSWIDLPPTPTTSHPQHVAAEIRAVLTTTI